MFSESFTLFFIGNIMPLLKVAFPLCLGAHVYCRPEVVKLMGFVGKTPSRCLT